MKSYYIFLEKNGIYNIIPLFMTSTSCIALSEKHYFPPHIFLGRSAKGNIQQKNSVFLLYVLIFFFLFHFLRVATNTYLKPPSGTCCCFNVRCSDNLDLWPNAPREIKSMDDFLFLYCVEKKRCRQTNKQTNQRTTREQDK